MLCTHLQNPLSISAVHLNFCPAPSPSSLLSLIPSRTLLAYLPRWAMSDVQREKLSKALDYSEKGSAYYVMQRLTVSSARREGRGGELLTLHLQPA